MCANFFKNQFLTGNSSINHLKNMLSEFRRLQFHALLVRYDYWSTNAENLGKNNKNINHFFSWVSKAGKIISFINTCGEWNENPAKSSKQGSALGYRELYNFRKLMKTGTIFKKRNLKPDPSRCRPLIPCHGPISTDGRIRCE